MVYLADFHGRNWCNQGFDEKKTQQLALLQKPKKTAFSLDLTP